jgi:hypothetical protein
MFNPESGRTAEQDNTKPVLVGRAVTTGACYVKRTQHISNTRHVQSENRMVRLKYNRVSRTQTAEETNARATHDNRMQ